MSASSKKELAAVEAVAAHFSAKLERSGGGSCTYLLLAKKRIHLSVATIKRSNASRSPFKKPRLRFDRVVLRLVGDLKTNLDPIVPDGESVVITVTAPIRHPSKTAATLEERIRVRLASRSARVEINETIHGNQTRVRFVTGVAKNGSKVIGFVHNPDSDSSAILDITQALLQGVSAAADKRALVRFARERWLAILVDDGVPFFETCQQIYSQLSIPSGFKKILMVLADGRVETLSS